MNRALRWILVGYVFLSSVIVMVGNGAALARGQLEVGFSSVVTIALAGIGIATPYLLLRKERQLSSVLIAWWISQLIQVKVVHFDSVGRTTQIEPKYWGYTLFTLGFDLGWNLEDGRVLFISVNVLAILGVIASTMWDPRREVSAWGDPETDA